MQNKLLPLLAAVIIIASAGFALYPTVSQWVNAMLSESAIMHYNDTVDTLSFEDKEAELIKAEEYNRGLSNAVSDSFSSEAFEDDERYNSILDLTDDGQIGTVDIPSIDCQLPVFHGSNEEMLSKGAVHLVGTAFPIGGGSTRSVISAHTAYPGKILFDRLTEVELGDEFSVTVLGKTLYYKVTEVNVILPEEAEYLMPEKGRDLVTLVTCTPYSVNTHRLLVTGERDNTPRETVSEPDDEQHIYDGLLPNIIVCAVLWTLVAVIGLAILKRVTKRKMKHEK